jgi:hypothetical protein
MSATKTYPVEVLLTVASGKMLCEFPALHEAATDLAGWAVFTHHLASQELSDGMAAKVIRQVPWMPGAIENMPTWDGLPRDEVKPAIDRYVDRIRAAHGDTATIDLGEPLPSMGVFDGLERLGTAR